jgi:hypothetical protein
MSPCIRAQYRLRHLRSNAFSSLSDSVKRAAHASGLVNRRSGASAQAAQYHPRGTERIVHGPSAGAAGSLRHSDFIAEIAIAVNAHAIEPRLIEVLAGLHVESHGDGIFLAYGIRRRPPAVAAAEVLHRALVRQDEGAAAVAIAISVAITVVVAILLVLGRSQRAESHEKKNRQHRSDTRRSTLTHIFAAENYWTAL